LLCSCRSALLYKIEFEVLGCLKLLQNCEASKY
jgi:hypothetical protein